MIAERLFEPGDPSLVTIKAIKTGPELGFDTRQPLALTQKLDVEGTAGQGIYVLPDNHSLREGDTATVTPLTRRYPSGGSLTIYKITPLISD